MPDVGREYQALTRVNESHPVTPSEEGHIMLPFPTAGCIERNRFEMCVAGNTADPLQLLEIIILPLSPPAGSPGRASNYHRYEETGGLHGCSQDIRSDSFQEMIPFLSTRSVYYDGYDHAPQAICLHE